MKRDRNFDLDEFLDYLHGPHQYWFVRIFNKIKRLLKWLPIIWKDKDYDYSFLYIIMEVKIDSMLKYFQNESLMEYDYKDSNIIKPLRILKRRLSRVSDDDRYMDIVDFIYERRKYYHTAKIQAFYRKYINGKDYEEVLDILKKKDLEKIAYILKEYSLSWWD